MRVFILPTGFAVQKRPNISKSTCDFLTNKSKTTSSSSRVLTRRINSPTVLRRPFQGQHFSHSVNSCYIRPSFNSLATIYLCRGRTYYFKFSITYQLLPSSILTLHTPYWRWVSLSVYQRFQTTPTNDSPHGIADPSKWQLLLTHSDVQTRASLTSTTSEFHPSCVSKFYIVTPQATHTTKLTFTYHHLSHSNIAITFLNNDGIHYQFISAFRLLHLSHIYVWPRGPLQVTTFAGPIQTWPTGITNSMIHRFSRFICSCVSETFPSFPRIFFFSPS